MVVPGYRLEEELGRGGFAVVHRAIADDGRVVAIKLALDLPGAAARLDREAEALRALGVRHAPALVERGSVEGNGPFLVMEYVADPTLARVLADASAPLAPEPALALFSRIVRVVAAAHAAGVVHRDLTPSNILCGARVRLIDLGLAAPAGGTAGQTHVEEVIGTAAFMAPEQWRPGATHDERTDIYALGCLLQLMVTGAPPFGGSRGELQEAHLGQRPELPSRRVPTAAPFDELVIRCLAKAPGDRWPSAPALLDAASRVALTVVEPAAAPARRSAAVPTAMAFVLFATEREPTTIDQSLAARGARVVYGQAGRCAVAVDRSELALGVREAHALAQELVGDVTESALVDVLDATVRARASGPPRITAPALSSADRYPAPGDPPGVQIGARAAAHLDAPRRVIPGREDRWSLDEAAPAPAVVVATLFGRERELAELEATVDDVVAGHGPIVTTVIGDPGQGKSRFAQELVSRLRARGLTVIATRAGEPLGGDLDAHLRELVRVALRIDPDLTAADAEGRVRSELEPVAWAAVAVVMGWRRPDDDELVGLAIAPGALRTIAARTAGLALRDRARREPLAVVVDDAHFADVASLDALELAALAEAGAPLWVCALARPELRASRPAWGQRARRHRAWQLGALDDDAADALARAALAPVTDVSASALAHLRARAGGTPLLLLELIAALRRAGAIRRHGKGSAWYLASDELDRLTSIASVSELAGRELAALAPAMVAHAELVAVLGDTVDVAEVRAVIAMLDARGSAGDLPLDARVGLERLAAAGCLVDLGGGRFGFRHALVRDAIQRAIPTARRERLHAAAADQLGVAADAVTDAQRLPRLASHLAGAGRRAEAALAFAGLALDARLRHAYVDAERSYSAALAELDGDGRLRCELLQQRGVVRTRLGRYGDARVDLDAALAAAEPSSSDAVAILLDLAMTLDWCDEWRGSEQATERAAAAAGAQPPPAIEARLALARGRSHHRFSRDADAVPLLTRAAELAAGLGPSGYETQVVALVLLGYILPGLDRLEEARAVLDRVIATCTQAGDRWHLAAAHNNRVMLWTALGERERLIADLEQVRAIGRELGYDRMEWFAHFNLAEALFWMGDVGPALTNARAAIEIDDRSLGEQARPRSRLLLARILAWHGELVAARAAWLQLRAHQDAARLEGRADALLVPGEQVQLDAVARAATGATATDWEDVLERARANLTGQELIEIFECRARAALREGLIDEERAAITAALEIARGVPNLSGRRLRERLDAVR